MIAVSMRLEKLSFPPARSIHDVGRDGTTPTLGDQAMDVNLRVSRGQLVAHAILAAPTEEQPSYADTPPLLKGTAEEDECS